MNKVKTKLPGIHISTKDDICVAVRYTWCYATGLTISSSVKVDIPISVIKEDSTVLLIERVSNGSSIVLNSDGLFVSIINGDFGYIE